MRPCKKPPKGGFFFGFPAGLGLDEGQQVRDETLPLPLVGGVVRAFVDVELGIRDFLGHEMGGVGPVEIALAAENEQGGDGDAFQHLPVIRLREALPALDQGAGLEGFQEAPGLGPTLGVFLVLLPGPVVEAQGPQAQHGFGEVLA